MERTTIWTSGIGGAALLLGGCVADASNHRSDLDERLFDPGAPLGVADEGPFRVPFDAGPDASRLGDVPGRDDDRAAVDEVPYGSFNEHLPMRCGGAANDQCPEGEVCCPATQRCVPETCPDCCSADDYYRFTEVEAPNPERLPDVNPVGPPPEGDGRDGTPRGGPEDPDPGPMPPPPNAP